MKKDKIIPPYCFCQFAAERLRKWRNLHHDKGISTTKLLKKAKNGEERSEIIAASFLDVEEGLIREVFKPKKDEDKAMLDRYFTCRTMIKGILSKNHNHNHKNNNSKKK